MDRRVLAAGAYLAVLIWVLLQPLQQPGVWDWQIIGAFETQRECEAARWEQPYQPWTICAKIPE